MTSLKRVLYIFNSIYLGLITTTQPEVLKEKTRNIVQFLDINGILSNRLVYSEVILLRLIKSRENRLVFVKNVLVKSKKKMYTHIPSFSSFSSYKKNG